MILTIIIVVVSLILLMSLHELGHFLLAKKFSIIVEEFGIGYPPRIWGKKIKNTIYSINWLPLGAFVKILGEDDTQEKKKGSFASKPLWQRALVLFGGVASFWIIAFLIISVLAGVAGVPTSVPDSFNGTGKETPKVVIFSVAKNSPADLSGIKPGDEIKVLSIAGDLENPNEPSLITNKVSEVQQFIADHKGQEITMFLRRGDKIINITTTPRVDPPKGEGALGVALARAANLQVAWYKAPWVGLKITALQTKDIPVQWYEIIKKKINKVPTPEVQLVGPVGLGQIMTQALGQGTSNYLMLVAIIAIYLAFFNLLPIPALDGGRLLFIAIEAIRRKPVKAEVEQKITTIFFMALILMALVFTFQDVRRLF
ncbi:MAG: M50 family metallopeptidase [Candidatus Pacebacteria bacterium]|nr:M50 family metallopeptidase [Candidatus Paceibacterota bacterium]